MADQTANEILNHIVGCVFRSLLQYSIESCAWTTLAESSGGATAEQQAVEQMASRQQEYVARLADLLAERGEIVDFGTYPDNSALHYVSLDFFIDKIIEDEQYVVAELEGGLKALASDAEASSLVSEILTSERANLAKLRELRAKAAVPA
jgi:hypothetical protein